MPPTLGGIRTETAPSRCPPNRGLNTMWKDLERGVCTYIPSFCIKPLGQHQGQETRRETRGQRMCMYVMKFFFQRFDHVC